VETHTEKQNLAAPFWRRGGPGVRVATATGAWFVVCTRVWEGKIEGAWDMLWLCRSSSVNFSIGHFCFFCACEMSSPLVATVLLAVTAAVLLTGSIFYTEQAAMPHSQDAVSVCHGQRCDQYFQPVDLSDRVR
jgi:hypothetical protein